MPSEKNQIVNRLPYRPGMPPQARAAFRPLVVLFLFIVVFGGAAPVVADQTDDQAAHRFDLLSGLSALVDFEGGLAIYPSGSRFPMLQAELASIADSRRRRPSDRFSAVVSEGVEGGHRGFSSRADDDRDGRTDEDPLDGIDNDRDGKIDEDFAAISDAMVAVHLSGGGSGKSGVQMEYYHWGHASLGSTVFINAGGGFKASTRGAYRIRTQGPDWQEVGIKSLLHSGVGQPEKDDLVAFVSRVNREDRIPEDDPCSAGTGHWLGVMILDSNSPTRILLDQDRLEFPLGETAVPLAVCTADSWLQLNRTLGEARRLYEGLTDPADNRRARWIAPPACSACRVSGIPDFDLHPVGDGTWVLSADIKAGQCGLLDPDLFQVDGLLLGAPREIRWVPANGKAAAISWSCATADHLRKGAPADLGSFRDLAGLLDHKTQGRLEFIFDDLENIPAAGPGSAGANPAEVSGSCLDGRRFQATVRPPVPAEEKAPVVMAASPDPEPATVEEVARGFAEDRARLLNTDQHNLSLSPDLLMGYPNPFNDIISIRFTVPVTMKEAFVWKKGAEPPTEISFEGEVPWSGGQPGVSVKIYSINGQELVTLHSATLGSGDYTAQWNGTDAFGRKVASGTYFCKLQMDNWSVTRRLVFIR